jgi:hypothetical protein
MIKSSKSLASFRSVKVNVSRISRRFAISLSSIEVSIFGQGFYFNRKFSGKPYSARIAWISVSCSPGFPNTFITFTEGTIFDGQSSICTKTTSPVQRLLFYLLNKKYRYTSLIIVETKEKFFWISITPTKSVLFLSITQ